MDRKTKARGSVLGGESSIPLGGRGREIAADGAHTGNPYSNLLRAGDSLRGVGGFLKVIGVLAIIGGAISFIFGLDSEDPVAISLGAVGVAWGVSGFVAGLFVSAAGEAGKALADIALNTGRMAQQVDPAPNSQAPARTSPATPSSPA
jgi:hypothetical protein